MMSIIMFTKKCFVIIFVAACGAVYSPNRGVIWYVKIVFLTSYQMRHDTFPDGFLISGME